MGAECEQLRRRAPPRSGRQHGAGGGETPLSRAPSLDRADESKAGPAAFPVH